MIPEKFYSPTKSISIRTRAMRLRSIDYFNLSKTTDIQLRQKSESKSKSNIIQFVFDDQKKKNEIGRIIDNYFDDNVQALPHRQHKSVSLIDFAKIGHITRKRTPIKPKLTIPLDISEIKENNSLEAIVLPPLDKQSSNLPPIFEEEPETPSKFNVLLLKTVRKTPRMNSSRKSSKSKSKEIKKIEENSRFTIAVNKDSIVKNYIEEGMNLLYLELRAHHLIKELNVQHIYSYGGGNTLHYRLFSPFRKLLYNVTEEIINSQPSYLITPLPLYDQLFNNGNELLLHLIKNLLLTLVKIKGRVINNNINFSNLHFHKETLLIDSWATSAIKQPKLDRSFLPILRDREQWFIILEYLPPEMLESIISQIDYDMFQYSSSIDMWSVGSLILQIITLIPLHAVHKFMLSHNRRIVRRGLYCGRCNDIGSVVKRQKKLCGRLKSQLEKLGEIPQFVDSKIIELMVKMLRLSPAERLTPQEGLKIIG